MRTAALALEALVGLASLAWALGHRKAAVYRTAPGDSLRSVASKAYGDAQRWPEVYKANERLLMSSGELAPGMELRIP